MGDKSYTVYPNDLKYKKHRHLTYNDLQNVSKEHQHLIDIDMDTIEYRLKECIDNGSKLLDLSHLGLTNETHIQKLVEDNPKIIENIDHMFFNGNELKSLPSLKKFKKLITLDISHNKLSEIPELPVSIIEVNCGYNNVRSIKIDNLTNLQRLNCQGNKITSISGSSSLKNLICNQNRMTYIINYEQLEKLSCRLNQLTAIDVYDKLIYLDCKKNNIVSIGCSPKLETIYCDYNNVSELPSDLPMINSIFCNNNSISNIPYYTTLKHLVCSKQLKGIHKDYKLNEAKESRKY